MDFWKLTVVSVIYHAQADYVYTQEGILKCAVALEGNGTKEHEHLCTHTCGSIDACAYVSTY